MVSSRLEKKHSVRVLSRVFVFATLTLLTWPAHAQENTEFLIALTDRLSSLESEMRDLRGTVDELRHNLSQLQKQFDTLNTDLEIRLKEGGDKLGSPPLPSPAAEDSPSPAPLSTTPSSSTSAQDYEKARSFLEKGDYKAAEKAFSDFLETYPEHDYAKLALYWLGVTYFVENAYEKAAATFAKVYKQYPKSEKAPDSLLKLAKALGALNRKEDACTTLDELAKLYPSSFPSEVANYRQKYSCK